MLGFTSPANIYTTLFVQKPSSRKTYTFAPVGVYTYRPSGNPSRGSEGQNRQSSIHDLDSTALLIEEQTKEGDTNTKVLYWD